MDKFVSNFLNVDIVISVFPQLLLGLKNTVILSVIAVPGGVFIGLIIAVLFSMRIRALNIPLIAYIDFLRAFPPLVLLIFVYYGLPFLGLELSAMSAVIVALLLNTSAYFSEVIRAGIESVPRGQIEAARATGLTGRTTLVQIVLPQAIRNILPDLISNILETIKLTSLASVVTLPELLRAARLAQGNLFNSTPLVAAALIYLALLWPLVRLITRLERRNLAT